MIKVVVAGSRDFNNQQLVDETLDKMFARLVANDCFAVQIISGHARGADTCGENWARSKGMSVDEGTLVIMPADWNKYGKSAGARRNEQMGDIATHLVAFWDGRSAGTRHMIDYCLKIGLWVKVIRV